MSDKLNRMHLFGVYCQQHPDRPVVDLLKEFKKPSTARKSLFKSEDGVDMYEGDKFYFVSNLIGEAHPYTVHSFSFMNIAQWGKVFSTKQKAEEYIKEYKPLFSVNDIRNMGLPQILNCLDSRAIAICVLEDEAEKKLKQS